MIAALGRSEAQSIQSLGLDVVLIFKKRMLLAGGSPRVLDCDGDYFKQVWSPLNKTLRRALDTIVEVDPRYRWQVVDQVINLLPAEREPALLQTRIKEFRAENISLAMDTASPLLALPEVKKAMDYLHH